MILTTRVWIEARLKIAAKPFTGSRRSDNDDGDWHGDENDRFKGISGHVFLRERIVLWILTIAGKWCKQDQHDAGWYDAQIEEGRLRCWWRRAIKKKEKESSLLWKGKGGSLLCFWWSSTRKAELSPSEKLIGHPRLNQQHLQWAIFTFSWYFDMSWHGCANSICIPSDHLTEHTFTSAHHLLIDWLLYLSFADGNAAKVKAERLPGSQRSTGTFLWLGEAGSLSDKDLCRVFVLPNWPKCTPTFRLHAYYHM